VKNTFLSLVALTATLVSPAFSQHIDGYTSLGTYNLRGTYVLNAPNPVTNKIYANSQSSTPTTTIDVISGTTHKITTSVTANAGVYVLAVNSATNSIYSLNVDGTVSVIDGSVDQVIATIPALTTDNCVNNMVIDDSANKLVLIDECNSTAYVLDGSSYALLATVNIILQYAATAAVNPVTHLLYITGDNDNAYAVVDLTAYTATKVSVGGEPYGVAVDTTYNRIFIGDDVFDDLYVFDGATNTLLNTVPVTYNGYGFVVNQKTHILAVSDDYQTVYFYHDFNMSADGQVSFGPKHSILFLSGNSNNNLFYTGVSPINALAYVQGPTH
jgi:DNA-binding beta-propeller fold protein YncE